MKHNAKFFENRLEELKQKVTSEQKIDRNELYQWASECVSIFSYVGVPSDIIRGFMKMFENADIEFSPSGPLKEMMGYWNSPSRQSERISGFFYPQTAFVTAKMLLNKIEEEERLVPQTLIDLLKNKIDYSHLATSLESMESAYQSKDSENLLAAGSALLQSLIELHSTIKTSKNNLKNKLKLLSLSSSKPILSDFGVDAELIELFQNFRYLRNKTSQHKKKGVTTPPLSVAYGFSSLLLLFLYGTLDRGVLIVI